MYQVANAALGEAPLPALLELLELLEPPPEPESPPQAARVRSSRSVIVKESSRFIAGYPPF